MQDFSYQLRLFISLFIFGHISFLHSHEIHTKMDMLYAGTKSPIIGIKSIVFTALDTLLVVIEYNKLVIIISNTSPIISISNIAAAKYSKVSEPRVPGDGLALHIKGAPLF
jgi:hypothetical protein